MTWRYQLSQRTFIESPHLAGIYFENEWLTILGGMMAIAEGYSWDGCSPALRLPLGIWLGPWDGPRGTDGLPTAFRASLAHDVLCQFADEVPITKSATLALFDELLRIDQHPLRWLYVTAVDWFGPQHFSGDQ